MPVSNSRRLYYSINKGKICHYADGKIYEYTKISGRLVNITTKNDEKYGQKLCIHLVDPDDHLVIEMFLNSGYAYAFLMVMQNIDCTMDINIIPSLKEGEAGKKETSLFINQNHAALKWFYNKLDMKDLPPLIPSQVKNASGQMVPGYDNKDRINFLLNKIQTAMIPELQRLPNPYPNHGIYEGNTTKGKIAGEYFGEDQRTHISNGGQQDPAAITEPIDDLPF